MLTQEYLLQRLSYKPDNGRLTWWYDPDRTREWNRKMVGTQATRPCSNGYLYVLLPGQKPILAHRLIWIMVHGRFPIAGIDHVNGARADNRLDNPREASQSQNLCNAAIRSDNTSGFKGVSLYKATGRWAAEIWSGGRKHFLGYFDTAEAASAAREAAAATLHGEFAHSGVRTHDAVETATGAT